MLANQDLLLRKGGETIACSPSRDARGVPRMGCALVGARGEPVARSVVAQVTDAGLDLVRAGRVPEHLYHAPLRDAILALQTRRATYGTLEAEPGRRYLFSGTRVVCALQASGSSLRCEVVGRDLQPLTPGYGFAIGFRGVQVLRVGAGGFARAVFTARHGR